MLREDISVSLSRWGWNSYFEAMWSDCDRENTVAARVVAQQRKFWRVAGEFGECLAEASGKLRLAADEGAEWPAVGDWVAAELQGANAAAVIRAVLPRRSRFLRKSPGKKIEKQVIAANVDTALLVSALDGDFNPRRVERYLAQCWESGARPVLVLNKADTCEDAYERAAEMERVALGTAVCVVSAKTGQGIEAFAPLLVPGHTLVMLGSSGVGKSTLANRLFGESLQKVKEVRESDSRGRHTTTTRELFVLPCGALLIDTPGLRELQLWDAEDGLAQAFADIDALAAQCRFSDCRHETEPGCAVQAALRAGTLDPGRLENRRKLSREQEFLRRKMDPEARWEWKNRVKSLHREVKRMYKGRKKGKDR
jgi:ribosome biogenesis GTPase